MPTPLLDALAKSLVLLLIAAGAVLLLRRSSASLRALILTTALAGPPGSCSHPAVADLAAVDSSRCTGGGTAGVPACPNGHPG